MPRKGTTNMAIGIELRDFLRSLALKQGYGERGLQDLLWVLGRIAEAHPRLTEKR